MICFSSLKFVSEEDIDLFSVSEHGRRFYANPHSLTEIDQKSPYPFKCYAETEKEVLERFDNLRSYEFPIVTGRSARVFNIPCLDVRISKKILDGADHSTSRILAFIKIFESNYDTFDNFDFNEEARIQARRRDTKITAAEFWSLYCSNFRFDEKIKDVRGLRDKLAYSHPECTTFKPSLLVGFVKMLCPPNPRLLDPYSGWGERFVGAKAVDASLYVGTDPNPKLQKGYQKIRELLPSGQGTFLTYQLPFEELDLAQIVRQYGKFHAMVSSPPYFDLEIYDENPETCSSQSIQKYPTLEEWFENFLMFGIFKAVNFIEDGGYIIININDPPKAPEEDRYVEKMIGRLEKSRKLVYLGCLPQWTGNPRKSAQPFFIFRVLTKN